MTPRRNAWLLVAVLCVAAVGVVSVSHESIWLTLAYDRHASYPWQDGVHAKRSDWLPGKDIVVRPQICEACYFADNLDEWRAMIDSAPDSEFDQLEMTKSRVIEFSIHHWQCWDQLDFNGWWSVGPEEFRFVVQDFRCICAHASHREE